MARCAVEALNGQLGIFGRDAPTVDPSFKGMTRTSLGLGAWFEYAAGWLSGHESILTFLVKQTEWHAERRAMYDRVVDVPRLYATLPQDGPMPPVLETARQTLSARYGEAFTSVSLGYYRDGRDSVAFHGDYIAREMEESVMATVSVGAPRRFLLKPTSGGASLTLSLGWGDLLVMGGTCQRTFQHAIPKVRIAQPRVAIMFRPNWETSR